MNIKFYKKQDLYNFLNHFDYESKKETKLSSVYFLVKYKYKDKNIVEPIYFTPFEDVYFASPCELYMSNINDDDLEEYVKSIYEVNAYKEAMKFEKLMQIDNMHYEIDCPQVEPFLPDEIEIVNVLTESECVKYLLHNM